MYFDPKTFFNPYGTNACMARNHQENYQVVEAVLGGIIREALAIEHYSRLEEVAFSFLFLNI
ncbi:hypothetical protein [Neobacillus sp. FSL H8-0543]|uniref:hypothetical protein n=1 Tax=Neobacillus sp. FSL H8-0543 TaxID=2954672 RepID=UPI00315811D4